MQAILNGKKNERLPAVVIGKIPRAVALRRVFSCFITTFSVNASIVPDNEATSITKENCEVVQKAQNLILVPHSNISSHLIIAMIHKLRANPFLCSATILVCSGTEKQADELTETSLLFEPRSNHIQYPLGLIDGHEVLKPSFALGCLLKKINSPKKVHRGTWNTLLALGSVYTKIKFRIDELKRIHAQSPHSLQIRDIQDLISFLMEPCSQTHISSVLRHAAEKSSFLKETFEMLPQATLDTPKDAWRVLKDIESIIEFVMMKDR